MTAVLILRFAEYAGAALLFGAPLFLLYARQADAPPGTRRLIGFAALIVVLAAPLHFFAQTAELAGSATAAMDPSTLKAAFVQMDFGKSSLVRGIAALLALAALWLDAPQRWRTCAVLGAIVCASFAWMGHGAATEGAQGWIHLAADIFHILAASAWMGALAMLVLWLSQNGAPVLLPVLRGFSFFGILFVAVLIVTGIVNSLFLIDRLAALWQSFYGQTLLAKIALFAAMLVLAARNRSLALSQDAETTRLRRNILLETGLGAGVLALVSILGMLPPPAL